MKRMLLLLALLGLLMIGTAQAEDTEVDPVALGLPSVRLTVSDEEFWGDAGIYSTAPEATFKSKPRIMAQCEFYDREGKLRDNHYVEVCVHGTASLVAPLKSLRIYYKKQYGNGRLLWDVFDGTALRDDGQVALGQKRIILRNGGNDRGGSTIRDLLAHRICAPLRLDSMAGQPVIVFINGEFYGLLNARERYDEKYFELHHGVKEEDLAIIEAISPLHDERETDFELKHGSDKDMDDFMDLMNYICWGDMRDPEQYAEACRQLNINSLIDMMIALEFTGCSDCINNNVKVWRDNSGQYDGGRWQYVLLDYDSSLGVGWGWDEDISYLYDSYYFYTGDVIAALQNNPEFDAAYRRRFAELLDTVFLPERTLGLLDELSGQIRGAIGYNIARWQEPRSMQVWENEIASIRSYLEKRHAFLKQWLAELE